MFVLFPDFGILMQSEIFQDQLWNFSTAYFTSSRYEVASEDMSQFLKMYQKLQRRMMYIFFSVQ